MIAENLQSILKDEMVPALGCTEPIAIAYAASLVTKHLGTMPERMVIECSPNIIKNVKSVIVPNSGGLKGIAAAAIMGAFAGRADKELQVLSEVKQEQLNQVNLLLTKEICTVKLLETPAILHIIITGYQNNDTVLVEIKHAHTNVTRIIKNTTPLVAAEETTSPIANDSRLENITISDIINFAKNCDYTELMDTLDQQIQCNYAVAQEGLSKSYGANVGQTILLTSDNTIKNRAKALAASGSDARMSGCDLPVVINSGSGNQGLTASVPVIEYAKELGSSKEELYRALILSNLVAIYEKQYIGKLSAYCGVVCAASGSAAAITMLKNGTPKQIEYAITNTLGIMSGLICDGAKPSCAAKIAVSIDAAIGAHEMAMSNNVLQAGDGIIKNDLDTTVKMVGRLASKGMRTTDTEILNIMLED